MALRWCSDAYPNTMLGYANTILTVESGTHIHGVKTSLTRVLNNLGKKSKVIQTRLGNPEMQKAVDRKSVLRSSSLPARLADCSLVNPEESGIYGAELRQLRSSFPQNASYNIQRFKGVAKKGLFYRNYSHSSYLTYDERMVGIVRHMKKGNFRRAWTLLAALMRRFDLHGEHYLVAMNCAWEVDRYMFCLMLHARIVRNGFHRHPIYACNIVKMFGKFGKRDLLIRASNEVHGVKRVVVNDVISALAVCGRCDDAIEAFEDTRRKGIADKGTMWRLFNAFSHNDLLKEAQKYYQLLTSDDGIEGIEVTRKHHLGMIEMLAKQGFLEEAEELLRKNSLTDSAKAWQLMITGAEKKNDLKLGIRACNQLFRLGNYERAFMGLHKLYFNAGDFAKAAMVREEMVARKIWKEAGTAKPE